MKLACPLPSRRPSAAAEGEVRVTANMELVITESRQGVVLQLHGRTTTTDQHVTKRYTEIWCDVCPLQATRTGPISAIIFSPLPNEFVVNALTNPYLFSPVYRTSGCVVVPGTDSHVAVTSASVLLDLTNPPTEEA
jgi:hypothetical protein